MLAKIKQHLKKENTRRTLSVVALCVGLGMSLYAPETFAATWEASSIKKLKEVAKFLIKAGKIICGMSLTAGFILWMFNKPNWKWTGITIVAGGCIAGIGNITKWALS